MAVTYTYEDNPQDSSYVNATFTDGNFILSRTVKKQVLKGVISTSETEKVLDQLASGIQEKINLGVIYESEPEEFETGIPGTSSE